MANTDPILTSEGAIGRGFWDKGSRQIDGAFVLPIVDTEFTNPDLRSAGRLRYNVDNGTVELFNGTDWVRVNILTGNLVDNTVESTPDINISTDESLFFDEPTREMRLNQSMFKEEFTWNTSDSNTFTLSFEPFDIVFINVNGKILQSQGIVWQFNPPDEIEILVTLDDGDIVTVCYWHYIETP